MFACILNSFWIIIFKKLKKKTVSALCLQTVNLTVTVVLQCCTAHVLYFSVSSFEFIDYKYIVFMQPLSLAQIWKYPLYY